MMFAHGFGCDQNMWRFVARLSNTIIEPYFSTSSDPDDLICALTARNAYSS